MSVYFTKSSLSAFYLLVGRYLPHLHGFAIGASQRFDKVLMTMIQFAISEGDVEC